MSDAAAERWLEWLRDLASYRPSDFLMFSPRTYWRLFELHNEAWWPLPVVLPAFGLALWVWGWCGGGGRAQRVGAAAGAAAAAFVGWAFVLGRYTSINWPAQALALLWAALCLVLFALAFTAPLRPAASAVRRRAGAVLAVWAMLGYPWLAPLLGRPLAQAEVFGLAPDPTGLGVLAWLTAGSVATAGATAAVWLWRLAWTLAVAHCLASVATLALLAEGLLSMLLALASAAAVAAAVAAAWLPAGRHSSISSR